MRHELAANERNKKKRCEENKSGANHCCFRVIQTPLELHCISIAHPFKGLIHALVYSLLEQVGAHDRNECKCQDQGPHKSDGNRIGHWLEEFSRGAAERVYRQIARNNDSDRIEDRPIASFRSHATVLLYYMDLAFAFP